MITAYKCAQCGHVMYPYHYRCINCGGREFEEFAPSDKAKLLTFTIIEQLPWGFDERGRVLGVTAVAARRGAASLAESIARAYAGVAEISFEGAMHRTDIGAKGLAR